jgi:hypothetical protein
VRRERLGRFETLAAEDEELVVDREAGEGGERLEHVVDPGRERWSRMRREGERGSVRWRRGRRRGAAS